MPLGLKRRNKDAEEELNEFPDAEEAVAEETLENASSSKKRKKGDDDSIDYTLSVDWGRKYKPAMTFGSRSMIEVKNTKIAKRVMRKVLISVAAVMVVLSLIALGTSWFIGQGLQKELDTGAANKKEIALRQPVAQFYDDFVQRQKGASGVLSKDIVWSKIQDSLRASLPAGTTISNEVTKYGEVCASPTPFEPKTTIGCIQVDLKSERLTDFGVFIANISAQKGLSDPYVTTSSGASDKGFNATATFNFDSSFISTKYSDFLQGSSKTGSAPAAPATPSAPATTAPSQ